MDQPPAPSLDALELAVAAGDREGALQTALRILKVIDDRYGRVDAVQAAALAADDPILRLSTRFCAAVGPLIVDPQFAMAPVGYEQLVAHHRWIELMFSASGFGSTAHLIPMLGAGGAGQRKVRAQNLRRMLVLFSAAAGMNLNLDEALAADAAATVSACLGWLGTRFCFNPSAHAFRELMLEWLPGRFAGVKLGQLMLQNIASPYMHCSYATTPRKHEIKADLIAQMRQGCLGVGAPEYDPGQPPPKARKPVVVVVTENFNDGHSVHRTHSRAVRALKERFRVVGVGYARQLADAGALDCFDEVIHYPDDVMFLEGVKRTAAAILDRRPTVVFHLGVGMSPYVIALASLRLAPIQAASFGHTATTRSPVVDYMILPEDFVGDPACFSETLALVPPEAMPYAPRRDLDYAAVRADADAAKEARPDGDPARIALAASAMKLGPPLFAALDRAARTARRPVEFQIFPLGCAGLGHRELQRRVAGQLPSAVVNEELPYGDYMKQLATCDFFVCPFPYGNMNSIIDAALLGLPGVCLDGPEAHAHADVAYFARMGFPKALATKTVDAYVAQIVRLADDPRHFARCSKAARSVDLEKVFFTGDESLFARQIEALIAAGAAPAARAELAQA